MFLKQNRAVFKLNKQKARYRRESQALNSAGKAPCSSWVCRPEGLLLKPHEALGHVGGSGSCDGSRRSRSPPSPFATNTIWRFPPYGGFHPMEVSQVLQQLVTRKITLVPLSQQPEFTTTPIDRRVLVVPFGTRAAAVGHPCRPGPWAAAQPPTAGSTKTAEQIRRS